MYAQKQNIYKLPIPRDIEECCEVLDVTYSDEAIKELENLPEDSIMYSIMVIDEVNLVAAWRLTERNRLTKYFIRKGFLSSLEMHETILISYYRYLNSLDVDLKGQANKYKKIREEQLLAIEKQMVIDTIEGKYIPYNIEDCFITLDRLLTDEEVALLRTLPNRDAVVRYLPTLCEWLMQEWYLTEPNRLQIYMTKRGIDKPFAMSSMILIFYYDWLHDRHQEWQKFEKRK